MGQFRCILKDMTKDPRRRSVRQADRSSHAAELLGALAAPARLKIVNALGCGEHSAGALMQIVGTSQPNVSQHLKALYMLGVVDKRREGAHVFYRIAHGNRGAMCLAICQQVSDVEAMH